MSTFYNVNNEVISLKSKPLASGGEGSVYVIKSNEYNGFCVKIFHDKLERKAKKIREKKLQYMISNPPYEKRGNNHILCWPVDLVYKKKDGKGFKGFMMPLAFANSILLYDICQIKIKGHIAAIWSQKYSRSEIQGLISRLKLCVNIASAVNAVHKMKSYTLVDFKPQNILITDDGKVSLIDLDSIQISDTRNNTLLNATVNTPGYIPPEGRTLQPSVDKIGESWDRFSVAVIFYEILFGIHPFAITPDPQFSKKTEIHEHIKSGFFPFGNNANKILFRPHVHDRFSALPKNFQALFLKAFDKGLFHPTIRPSAEEWGKNIYSEISKAKKYNISKKKARTPQASGATTSTPTGSLSSSKINRPRRKTPNSSPRQTAPSPVKKQLPQLSVNNVAFRDVLISQIFARGLYQVDPHKILQRKKVYFYAFCTAILSFTGALFEINIFKSDFGFSVFTIGLIISHIIGTIDAVGTYIYLKNK